MMVAGGGEHAAHAVAVRDLGIGDLGGVVPRIWRTLQQYNGASNRNVPGEARC